VSNSISVGEALKYLGLILQSRCRLVEGTTDNSIDCSPLPAFGAMEQTTRLPNLCSDARPRGERGLRSAKVSAINMILG